MMQYPSSLASFTDLSSGTQAENDRVISWPEKEDVILLRHIQQGNHHAFSTLVTRHHARFYRLAYRCLQELEAAKEAAEDIVQDAFLALWERPDLWQEERGARFTTWFHRLVVNRCHDWRKKKRPLPLYEDVERADDRMAQDETLIASEEQEAMEKAMGRLPERQRIALHLCFAEAMSNQDAADEMGIKVKALESLLMRGKANLRKRLNNKAK